MKRRIRVRLRLGDVPGRRCGGGRCSCPTHSALPASSRAGTANSIMPAQANTKASLAQGPTHQMTSASLKFNAVVRGLILGVIITLGASVSGGLFDTHFDVHSTGPRGGVERFIE